MVGSSDAFRVRGQIETQSFLLVLDLSDTDDRWGSWVCADGRVRSLPLWFSRNISRCSRCSDLQMLALQGKFFLSLLPPLVLKTIIGN